MTGHKSTKVLFTDVMITHGQSSHVKSHEKTSLFYHDICRPRDKWNNRLLCRTTNSGNDSAISIYLHD